MNVVEWIRSAATQLRHRIPLTGNRRTFDIGDDLEAIRRRARTHFSWPNPVTGITVEDHSLGSAEKGLWLSRAGECVSVELAPDEQVMFGNVAVASAAPVACALTYLSINAETFDRLILITLPGKDEPLRAAKVETVLQDDGSSSPLHLSNLLAISEDGQRVLVRRLKEDGKNPELRPAYRTFRFNLVTKEWAAILA